VKEFICKDEWQRNFDEYKTEMNLEYQIAYKLESSTIKFRDKKA
jgi:hypothetical protein